MVQRMAAYTSWPVGASLAECPVWIPEARLLAWVDILGPTYNLLDPTTGINRSFPVHAKIGSAAPFGAEEAILALEDGLWLFRQGRTLDPLPSPDMTDVHFNDGKRDPAGRFWVGTRAADGSPGGGALYRVDQEGRVTRMDADFDVPNVASGPIVAGQRRRKQSPKSRCRYVGRQPFMTRRSESKRSH